TTVYGALRLTFFVHVHVKTFDAPREGNVILQCWVYISGRGEQEIRTASRQTSRCALTRSYCIRKSRARLPLPLSLVVWRPLPWKGRVALVSWLCLATWSAVGAGTYIA